MASRKCSADAPEVRPGCITQPTKARRREDRLRAPRVRQARVALDGPVRDQAIDEPRDAAPAQQDAIRKLVHPEPTAGRLRQLEERVVLGQ